MRDFSQTGGRIGRGNLLVAAALGLMAFAALLVMGVSGLDPSMWNETAVAVGIRPPRGVIPGLWRILAGRTFGALGYAEGAWVLSLVGKAVGGLCAALFYLSVRQTMAFLIRFETDEPVWGARIAPFFAAVGTVLFMASEPFGRIFRTLTPDAVLFLVSLASIHLSYRWFARGGWLRLLPLVVLMGLASAESPFGFLLPIAFILLHGALMGRVVDGHLDWTRLAEDAKAAAESGDDKAVPGALPRWRMFFLYFGGLVAGVALNLDSFAGLGGIRANGLRIGDVYFRYLGDGWHALVGSATLIGWLLAFGFSIVPLAVGVRLLALIGRKERDLDFLFGVIAFLVALLAILQTGVIPSAMFWTLLSGQTLVSSGFLLCVFVGLSMATLSFVGASFALLCDRICREEGHGTLMWRTFRVVSQTVCAALALLALFQLHRPVEAEMQRIVDAAVAETVAECEDADWVFADGRLDPAIELASVAQGGSLRALDMMSGASAWDVSVRMRGFDPADDDARLVKTGVPVLFRVWAEERTNGMDRAAFQLGFELWKRKRRKPPPTSGLVARPAWPDDGARVRGIGRAKELADAVLALSERVGDESVSPELRKAYSDVTWRLARLARAREDADTASALEDSDSILREMLSHTESERLRVFMQMTPREGLRFALHRADFVEARHYATTIIHADADDIEANFALGMGELRRKKYAEAERYLVRCLKRNPNEPAVLNNLSVIYRKKRQYELAVSYAKRALKRIPDSPEAKKTLEDALKKAD